jgi:hypothetical protein
MTATGRLTSEKRKLATRYWFVMFRFPPSRSVIMGIAATGVRPTAA